MVHQSTTFSEQDRGEGSHHSAANPIRGRTEDECVSNFNVTPKAATRKQKMDRF